MAFKVRMKRGVNIKRVVTKIVVVVLSLYVGGTIMTEIGNVMNNTHSPFYPGLSLIGWTIGTATNGSHFDICEGAAATYGLGADPTGGTCITATSGAGILTVVGIIGIASVVMEFVTVNF